MPMPWTGLSFREVAAEKALVAAGSRMSLGARESGGSRNCRLPSDGSMPGGKGT